MTETSINFMQKVITISPKVSGVPALIIMPGLSEFLSGGCERHNLYPRAVPTSSPAVIIVRLTPASFVSV
ncbi:hypothetical protein, partial [Klebsiella pneumoniae]|uniref:hypothetical protein n=1 Tax=Klebsiella pneumoniae TaxID=573 RepID=UPI003B58C28D